MRSGHGLQLAPGDMSETLSAPALSQQERESLF